MISRNPSHWIEAMNIGIGRLQRVYHKGLALMLGDRVFDQPMWRRLFGVPLPVYRPHPYLLYELNPDWRSPCGKSRHNPDGFRGLPIKTDPPSGRTRIVCMGESSTYCTSIIEDKDTYPARLEYHLKQAGKSVEVLNAGVGGYTSLENLMRYHFKIRYLKPNLLIYYFTHNDVHPRKFPSLSPDYREYSQSWYEPHNTGSLFGWWSRRTALGKGDIGKLVRRYSEYSGRRKAANTTANPPVAFRENLRALVRMARADGVQVMMALPNYHSADEADRGWEQVQNPVWRAVWEHRAVVSEMSRAEGFQCYDFSKGIPYPADNKQFPSECYQDAAHFNRRGADIAGRLLADELEGDSWATLFRKESK